MEEPANLEIAVKSITGRPADTSRFLGNALEFEYGVKGWWTTELYLDSESTRGRGSLFTGYRWENRFRLLPREHWINPVLYVEMEDINGADRTLLEIVNHDGEEDLAETIEQGKADKKRELEAKLILGSYFKGWTIAENFIIEENIHHEPLEFGYAAGVSRPLALVARPERCNLCPENFQMGVEVYGGLGTHANFGTAGTSHYVAPTIGWTLANGTTFRASPTFGMTDSSASFMLRFGVAYEINQFGRMLTKLVKGTLK